MELSDFPKDKIPLLQMEHLRQLDLMITRGISYERTAYTFLAQIELNDQLHCFKDFPSICVLLNEEGYQIRMRLLAEEMEKVEFPLGIRLATKGLSDTVNALYGSTLEMMAKLDHEVWLQNMLQTGWKYGTVEDKTIRVSPAIRHYDELSREEQERVQLRILEVPNCLKYVGLELYRKSF